MTEEDLKKWLSRANAIRMQREEYEAKVKDNEEIALRITRNYDSVRASASDDPHRIMDYVLIKNDQLLDVITDLLIDEYTAKGEAFEMIQKTLSDSRHRTVIINRYINGLTIKETAEAMGMGISRCNDYQKQALQIMIHASADGDYAQ